MDHSSRPVTISLLYSSLPAVLIYLGHVRTLTYKRPHLIAYQILLIDASGRAIVLLLWPTCIPFPAKPNLAASTTLNFTQLGQLWIVATNTNTSSNNLSGSCCGRVVVKRCVVGCKRHLAGSSTWLNQVSLGSFGDLYSLRARELQTTETDERAIANEAQTGSSLTCPAG